LEGISSQKIKSPWVTQAAITAASRTERRSARYSRSGRLLLRSFRPKGSRSTRNTADYY